MLLQILTFLNVHFNKFMGLVWCRRQNRKYFYSDCTVESPSPIFVFVVKKMYLSITKQSSSELYFKIVKINR